MREMPVLSSYFEEDTVENIQKQQFIFGKFSLLSGLLDSDIINPN